MRIFGFWKKFMGYLLTFEMPTGVAFHRLPSLRHLYEAWLPLSMVDMKKIDNLYKISMSNSCDRDTSN
jgi:hypothetical protein